MADTKIAYEEIRFDVRDPELTKCYVLIRNLSGDGLLGVQGWHYKSFPASMNAASILAEWAAGHEDPVLWPQDAPQNVPVVQTGVVTTVMQRLFDEHWQDAEGNPAGGVTSGTGFAISWQNGALGRGEERKMPNGAFVDTIIEAAARRLEFYQTTKFKCDDNEQAIVCLRQAIEHLRHRTADRESREVEGTHNA